jgi:hypothetical protein
VPRLALGLLLVALVVWSGGAAYTLWGNPEIAHFVHTHRVKHAWAEKLTRERGAKVVAYGGSSCEFAFDGERLLERHGLAVANLGRGAGMGAWILTRAALPEVRRGDTLVIALEPELMVQPYEVPALGIQFAFAVHHSEWVTTPALDRPGRSRASALFALRPGSYHVVTLLGKLLARKPLYRYSPDETRPSGWLQSRVKLALIGPAAMPGLLTEEGRRLLRAIRGWCNTNGVRVAYALPWSLTPENRRAEFQRSNAAFLAGVAREIPVLKDPRLGAYSVPGHFADTVWHLDGEGAALRTDEFAAQLKSWTMWTVEELERAAKSSR